jgi:molecular chaperone GrpE
MNEAVPPLPEEPAEAESPVVDLAQAKIEALQTENAALKDKVLRAVAETDNVRKRAQRDQEETARYANSGFARDLVNVAENLKRALENLTPEKRAQNELLHSLGTGVEMTLSELLSIFERNGIRRIDPMGEKFDHNFHQAVAQLDVPDTEAGTVVQVLQAGYAMHDRLLRPAMVGVAKAGGAEQKKVDTTA